MALYSMELRYAVFKGNKGHAMPDSQWYQFVRPFVVSEKSTYMALYIAFCQVWNCARYQMLPEYYPSEEEKKNPKLFADNVRREIADAINADITGASS